MSESTGKFDLFPRPSTVSTPSAGDLEKIQTIPRLWAIGGGKGGIGKTLLTSNLAVALTQMNKKVIVVDLDLGAANLHTSLGLNQPHPTLSDLILGRTNDIRSVLQPTKVANLELISGAQNNMGMANIRYLHKKRLIRKFRDLEADVVLLDLGAGTDYNTLDFFLLAQKKIVIMTPEPTSIENGYRFIKAAFYRLLRSSAQSPYIREIIESAMDANNEYAIRTPNELIARIGQMSPMDGLALQKDIHQFRMSLILNQVRTREESNLGNNIQLVSQRYFGIKLDYAGFLPYDKVVWQSVRNQVPFLVDAPNSMAVLHLHKVMKHLLGQGESDEH